MTVDDFTIRRARQLLEAGLAAVQRGDLTSARDEFKASAALRPTADALTFWGWMEHHLGDSGRAIELCHQAIGLDPDFGNPYNDIGSYLVSQGKLEEAIPWFEKAIQAKRYEPRQFPHMNLGRVYMTRRQFALALQHFERALAFAPGDPHLRALADKARLMVRNLN